MEIEKLILKNLIYNEKYSRKVLPFIKEEYFGETKDKLLYNEINDFLLKYNNNPTYESLVVIFNKKELNQSDFDKVLETLNELYNNKDEVSDLEWLIDETEKFCQDKAIYNAVLESVNIIGGKDKKLDKGAIPGILSDALSVTFDNNIGHSHIESYEERYEYYHSEEEKIPLDLSYFNRITRGGFPNKTLNIILSPPHKGKTLTMTHLAASCEYLGKKVLYISCEMQDKEIAKRIDANLLNITMDDLMKLSKEEYTKKIKSLKKLIVGETIIKEYPPTTASVIQFKALLNDLKLKKKFVPEIIFIDYLNLCASSRFKSLQNVNSYSLVKAIAEEIRGLAVEHNVPIVSATQTTRGASKSSDLDMDDVSESFGLPATCDFMIGLINTDELRQLNQVMFKQIKNRYSDISFDNKFIVGIDTSKMKLYDVELSGQDDIINDSIITQKPKINKPVENIKF